MTFQSWVTQQKGAHVGGEQTSAANTPSNPLVRWREVNRTVFSSSGREGITFRVILGIFTQQFLNQQFLRERPTSLFFPDPILWQTLFLAVLFLIKSLQLFQSMCYSLYHEGTELCSPLCLVSEIVHFHLQETRVGRKQSPPDPWVHHGCIASPCTDVFHLPAVLQHTIPQCFPTCRPPLRTCRRSKKAVQRCEGSFYTLQ